MFVELVEMGFVACLLGWAFTVADRDYYKKEGEKLEKKQMVVQKNKKPE